MIGLMPFAEHFWNSSMAPNMFPWSVSASAGCSSFDAGLDQLGDPVGAVEQAVLGVDVEVDEVRSGHVRGGAEAPWGSEEWSEERVDLDATRRRGGIQDPSRLWITPAP